MKSTSNLLDPKNSELPDILSSHDKLKPHNKSFDNLSGSSPDSADFDSCIGSPDKSEILTGKLQLPLKVNQLAKSATVGALGPPKVKRNFVIPPRDQRKSFGKEFIPTQQQPESQPLLIIKRTPSKINLPPEVGKPKVALKVNINSETKKYFGDTPSKTTAKPPPKPILKRAETLKSNTNQNKLVKQISLPETEVEKEQTKPSQSFNFEPEDSDLNDVDNYIEDLLLKKDELLKPIDPNKYSFTRADDPEDEEENVSSSIEDLLKALEVETKVDPSEIVDKPEEKIEDLLSWMDNLDHQTQERKVYRSYSDVKYKNLERILKAPKNADAVISKIPKDNLTYFERHLAGKSVEDADKTDSSFKLTRSKTDVFCNKPRSSVDLDAMTKVDIKKVLLKFEKPNTEDDLETKPPINLPKRKSFSSFKFAARNLENSESENDGFKKTLPSSNSMVNVSQIRENLLNKARSASNSRRNSFNEALPKETLPASSGKVESRSSRELEKEDEELSNILKDIEEFVDSTINKIGKQEKEKNGGQINKKTNNEKVGKTELTKVDGKSSALVNQVTTAKTSNELVAKATKAGDDKSVLQKSENSKRQTKTDLEDKNEINTQQLKKSSASQIKGNEILEPKPQNKIIQSLSTKPVQQNNKLKQNRNNSQGKIDSLSAENNTEKNHLPKSASGVNLNVEDNSVKGSTESVHSFRSAVDNPNLLEVESGPEVDNPTQYSVTVSVTESRVFPQFQQHFTPEPAPSINIDDLYAKVNKPSKTNAQNSPPSPTPRRNKNFEEIAAPQRPMRQKSFEGRKNPTAAFKSQIPVPVNGVDHAKGTLTPVVPQRKRSTNSSPQLNRRNANSCPPGSVVNESGHLEPRRETVKSFNAPKPQKLEMRNRDSKSKEKDCCLQ